LSLRRRSGMDRSDLNRDNDNWPTTWASLDKGYIVLFLVLSPVEVSEQTLEKALGPAVDAPFEVTVQDKQVRIYVIVIGQEK
jgi:hypothetical protein